MTVSGEHFKTVAVTLDSGIAAKGLVEDSDQQMARHAQSPIVVDFLSPKLKHRLKNGADGEAIVKALNVKRSDREGLLIYDFTAGLGTEAFLLARAGFAVIAFERDPLIFELLEDGLRRWREQEGDALNIQFRFGDAAIVLPPLLRSGEMQQGYAVTLDPMFEGGATEGKSLPKKEMATFRRMLVPTSASELQTMFDAAVEAATARVIVKRPEGAPDLVSTDSKGRRWKPVRRVEGKTARFDIYSCR